MPRKTAIRKSRRPRAPIASMRPRPDAAENARRRVGVIPGAAASMRPRPDAAENCEEAGCLACRPAASMRPRPDAAENSPIPAASTRGGTSFNEAAARCRGKHRFGRTWRGCWPSFNEAAARCRGKPGRGTGEGAGLDYASMRPRPDAAENAGERLEAAAPGNGFNEAAARCRGKPEQEAEKLGAELASMRPRPDAAENARPADRGDPRPGASMRPRPDAAENLRRRATGQPACLSLQ